MRYIVNPFSIYIFVFLLAVMAYPLRWSYLQPNLELDLIVFLVFTFVIALMLVFVFRGIKSSHIVNDKSTRIVWFILIFGGLAEFLYGGAIPFFEIMRGNDFKYNLFGIPTFHVFYLPYVSAVGVLSLYKYLILKKKDRLYIYLFSLFFCLMIFNRGALLFILISSFFLYCMVKPRINLRPIFLLICSIPIILYGFGYMGNYRMVSSGYNSDDIILTVGQATPDFTQSKIPNEYLWSYLYLVTPISNLQYQINSIEGNLNYFEVFKSQILLDAIQKRIYVKEDFQSNLITDEFNVSTLYGKSVQLSGMFGAYVIFFYFCFVILFLSKLSPQQYRSVVFSLLCSVTFFTSFTNTLVFSGFILQPVFIVLFSRFSYSRFCLV